MKLLEMKTRPWIFEVGASLLIAEAFFLYGAKDADRIYDLADVCTSISGILFGFLLTAIAMLTAMPENRLMNNMRKTGHLQELIRELMLGCGLHFATLFLSLSAAISSGIASRILLTLAVAVLAVAIFKTGQSGRKMKIVAAALYNAR